jgi:hypothetical protein
MRSSKPRLLILKKSREDQLILKGFRLVSSILLATALDASSQ